MADSFDSWTQRTSGFGGNLYGVCYGNGHFVCVGQTGFILTSTNGSDWQTNALVTTSNLLSVAFAQGQFVAVGQGGVILNSTDATSWQLQSSPTTNQLYNVRFCDDRFMASGNNGALITSLDGIHWAMLNTGTTSDLTGSAFGNGIFVILGGGNGSQGLALTSTNGMAWTYQSFPSLAFYGIAFGKGLFVGLNFRGITYYSSDGSIWNEGSSVVGGNFFSASLTRSTFSWLSADLTVAAPKKLPHLPMASIGNDGMFP